MDNDKFNSKLISSTSVSLDSTTLPRHIQDVIDRGIKNGLKDGLLKLSLMGVDEGMMSELCKGIAQLGDRVKKIELKHSLRNNRIASPGAINLLDTLKAINAKVYNIMLDENKQIDDECVKSLGEYIKYNKTIEEISLRGVQISDQGIELLVPYFDGNTTFKHLDLQSNRGITDKSVPLFVKLAELSHVEYIDLHSTSISQKKSLITPLAQNAIMYKSSRLYLVLMDASDDSIIVICGFMRKYGIEKLKKLYLQFNNVTSKGVTFLVDTLIQCDSVVSVLNLSINNIDDECMEKLGEFVQDNIHLESLNIAHNKITDKGIEMFSKHLIGNTGLKQLDLSHNRHITDLSVPYIVDAINKSYLDTVITWYTPLSSEKDEDIQTALTIPLEKRETPIKSKSKSAAKTSVSKSA